MFLLQEESMSLLSKGTNTFQAIGSVEIWYEYILTEVNVHLTLSWGEQSNIDLE